MERQARIIRWYLLCLLGIALSFWSVEYAILPLAMAGMGNFPGCSPCCSSTCCCSGTQPNNITIVIVGVTNNTCTGCGTLNGTWVLSKLVSGDAMCSGTVSAGQCAWKYFDTTSSPGLSCFGGSPNTGICLQLFSSQIVVPCDEFVFRAYYYNGTSYAVIGIAGLLLANSGTAYDCSAWSSQSFTSGDYTNSCTGDYTTSTFTAS